MEHRFHLSRLSSNAKLGGLPASTTSADSCPDNCSFKGNGCYGDSGPLSIHWRAVNDGRRGHDLDTFCEQVAKLPKHQLWRHNQVGDLPGSNGVIHFESLEKLIRANRGKKGFTYTHYDPTNKSNAGAIFWANTRGFTVNVSAESLEEADAYADLAVAPVVVALPANVRDNLTTPAGRTVTVCPATVRDDVVCATCALCQVTPRRQIIGFPAHGSGAKKVEAVFWLKSNATEAA